MQKRFCCLAVLATVLSTAPISLADASLIAPRAAIQANYDHIYNDVRHKNLSGAMRYFATDFMSEDAINTPSNKTPPMDLAQFQRVASDYAGASQSITGYAVIQQFSLRGNQVTVTVAHHVFIVTVPNPKTGRRSRGEFAATTQDTWIKRSQGWLMERGRGLSLRDNLHER